MESDRYILSLVQRLNPAPTQVKLVSRDVKLARQVAAILRRRRFISCVDLVDPLLYLLGIDVGKGYLLVDEGSVHWTDTNYFLDGWFREDGGIPQHPKFFEWPEVRKKPLRDSILFYYPAP